MKELITLYPIKITGAVWEFIYDTAPLFYEYICYIDCLIIKLIRVIILNKKIKINLFYILNIFILIIIILMYLH